MTVKSWEEIEPKASCECPKGFQKPLIFYFPQGGGLDP